jgi:hypothetical protein
LETFTVCGDEEFTDVYVLTAKLPPDVGGVDAGLEVNPEVSDGGISTPLGVGGGGIGEPVPISALKGVTSAEVLHRSPKGRWVCE